MFSCWHTQPMIRGGWADLVAGHYAKSRQENMPARVIRLIKDHMVKS